MRSKTRTDNPTRMTTVTVTESGRQLCGVSSICNFAYEDEFECFPLPKLDNPLALVVG